ncbi:MAG: tRNA epoxyqueuosine(34) reductase QueG [Firmicutes bacterium]|nr:tRNA epoxyqueuosine(34) reductase QueG [Bacillota bacterium]MCM1401048.1 tRNA epoxyqueuosine(34) reductase QueG [Bacteroides sp.]MCM1476967.1 tRNA epoxyqueuosine(34) reductase QueG [Bacteroides sp.]
MSSTHSPCFDAIFKGSGVAAYAITDVQPVDSEAQLHYDSWIAAGHHAGMDYMERNGAVRANPELLLPGSRSMICCAVPYPSPLHRPNGMAVNIASYALGDDYHKVIRDKLQQVAARIVGLYGGEARVCVDTAPFRERYWARRAGLGFIGRNNHLIIPGLGSCFFLSEILTTVHLPATPPRHFAGCGNCHKCIDACPAGAITDRCTVDCRRCLSYLTIEHRGEFPPETDLHGRLYGCDICASVCPYNREVSHVRVLPELQPRPAIAALTLQQVSALDQEAFSRLFSRSAIKRAKLAGLLRNARQLLNAGDNSGKFGKNV